MIRFQNVSKIYNSQSAALRDVSFSVDSGEFISLVGRSGAGKSTLLKLLIVEEKPSEGRVYFDKRDVHKMRPHEVPFLRRRIGAIFQDFKLLPQKTAYENIAFAMEVAGKPKTEIHHDVPLVLDLVGLKDKGNNFPRELSGGEKQRVAIARALVHRPDVIVADEPTGNLDPINTWDVIRLLIKINEMGTTVILATHDKEIINALSRRVVSLDKGAVIRDENPGRYILS
ncbi:cell division ATP-binding protein FtsE [Candidatus Azambacteria bacterium RIFCSPHIGHO2_01_FULL_44_55]|uniref:Cell division ATP-binding protein FtsE n=1 Tax=Candidatus Azambacteria bacterium RIFCSPLOWO2_02_FULL_44_14 TaxID=1797306 RepID=A0A1F5CA43_9BACT|nr:MAG: cell division ATP-binding protein FtsE [Candidatus Azambacteria bacterium RIFCSPLOWO2_01_FULL_44_84]OGD33562.1 MAG: cell division ATP-binding protein FtsE [Candidatus Azambacteria bacterium RIFCSPHIGHO2_02_FULL_45_18]OGD39728.1 MAG: cell division ATP-binding protein FtsE [Candidatus Azambacteria bacterium RIFCSPLOWO2_02_FULL_44_14]OGD41668.1 MAG: cell division ATP-binding protein FtsE [Candidatus Azambacteria bacterium RIFCSPHIGHO2_01_FULL_44_55]